jgi:glycosyltransferase involved in cell wall biosynthesis
MADDVRPFDHSDARSGDVTIFHYALPSPMTAAFGGLARGRVLQYHNITPAHFFAPYHPEVFRIAAAGRQDLATLAGPTDLALGDSEYNRRELAALGFRQTGVMPIALDLERITDAAPHPVIERLMGDGLTNFLFVGRIVPNKRIEDIIRLAEVYKRYIDANYRFVFVGRAEGMPRYYATLRALIAEFDMLAERFVFTGPVTDWELAAYYRTASVYLSLSEHEGFCVPLLEAMAADLPVFAYDSSAVADTLGGAGVCWSPKDLEIAAELLGQLAFDPAMRAQVIAGQRRRLAAFTDEHLLGHLRNVLEAVA